MIRKTSTGEKMVWRPVFKDIREVDKTFRYALGLPITQRTSGQIPFGYDEIEVDGKKIWFPDDVAFERLVQAKHAMEECGYREIAEWLEQETGRTLSHWGAQKLMEWRQPDDMAAKPLKERYEHIIGLLRQYEEEYAEMCTDE